MGKKKSPAAEEKEAEKEVKAEPNKAEAEEEDEEDSPVVKELKVLDDRCLEVERRFRAEVEELRKKYSEEQEPILAERSQVLARPSEDSEGVTGTPGLRGFWFQALSNHPEFEELIEEYDVPVLDYLSNITRSYLDSAEPAKGFKLEFHFAENPYFTNKVLAKEFHTSEGSPYVTGTEATEIIATEIKWNAGKDVTVERVQKKPKGGGAKNKKKAEKVTEEPRDSFFRSFFRSLKLGDSIPSDLNLSDARGLVDDDDEDDSQMMRLYLENEYNMACMIRDQLVPFAVRFYTGEACPAQPDDDDSDDDDDDSLDDDDEDDEEEEEEPPQIKLKKQPIKKKGGGQSSAQPGQAGGAQPECKQQ